MSESFELKAVKRERVGKGAAREARRNGMVPAVIYGDKKPPIPISVQYFDVLKQINTGQFLTHIINLDVGGEVIKVIPRDFQVDVVRDLPLHVDFMRLTKGAKVSVEVMVEFINEETCPGLKMGGNLNIVRHEIEMACDPESIPESVEVDLESAEIGDSIKVSDISLPDGVELAISDRDFTICSIVGRGATASSDEQEEGEEAVEETSEESSEE